MNRFLKRSFIILFVLLSLMTPCFAWDDGSGSGDGNGNTVVEEEIFNKINPKDNNIQFKYELQKMNFCSLTRTDPSKYNTNEDPNAYTAIEGEDYLYSRVSQEVYYAFILSDNIQGFHRVVTGSGNGPTYVENKSSKKNQRGLLYLHRMTKNTQAGPSRYLYWYGGAEKAITTQGAEVQRYTTIPKAPANTYLMIYNFVPHLSGTEGINSTTLSQIKSDLTSVGTAAKDQVSSTTLGGYVLQYKNGKTLPDRKYTWIKPDSPSTTNDLTGLMMDFNIPMIVNEDGKSVSKTVKVDLSRREKYVEVLGKARSPLYLGHIQLAFDEFRFHNTASYDFMMQLPMNLSATYGNGGASYPYQYEFPSYKTVNHGGIFRSSYDGSLSISTPKQYSGTNSNFKTSGEGWVREGRQTDTYFFDYKLRSRIRMMPVVNSYNNKITAIQVVEYYYDAGHNPIANDLFSRQSYLGEWRSIGFSKEGDAGDSSYFPRDGKTTDALTSFTTGTIVPYPWYSGYFSFDSAFSKSASRVIAASMTKQPEGEDKVIYEQAVKTFDKYMYWYPDLVLVFTRYINTNPEKIMIDPEVTKVLGTNVDASKFKEIIEKTYNKGKAINSDYTYASAVSAHLDIKKVYMVMFYKTMAFTSIPTEYSAANLNYVFAGRTGYNSRPVPAYRDYSDLYLLNNETRTGIAEEKEDNVIMARGTSVDFGSRDGIELYSFEENSTNFNAYTDRLEPIDMADFQLELGRPILVRSYLGYIADEEKINVLKEEGSFGTTVNKNLKLYMNVYYMEKELKTIKTKTIDPYDSSVMSPLAFQVPFIDQTLKKATHRVGIRQNRSSGETYGEPLYAAYEAVIKLTKEGLMYYNFEATPSTPVGWTLAKTSHDAPEVDNTYLARTVLGKTPLNKRPDTFDATKVKTLYLQATIHHEFGYYQKAGTSVGGSLPADYKAFYGNDNNNLGNDKAALFVPVSNEVNSWISYPNLSGKGGKPVVHKVDLDEASTKNKVYDHIYVYRDITAKTNPSSTKPIYEALEVDPENLDTNVKEGDKLKFEYYVKRDDLPLYPKYVEPPKDPTLPQPDASAQNNVLLSQVKVVLTDTFNQFTMPKDTPDTQHVYKDANSRTQGKLVAFAELKEDKTLGPFVTYDPNNKEHAAKRFEAGTILKFEHEYTVPTTENLKTNKDPRYDTKGAFNTMTRLQKVGITMNLYLDDSINFNKKDDWTKIILRTTPPQRNMHIEEIYVKDESGNVAIKVLEPGKPIYTDNFLDPSKNYYVEFKIKFEYPDPLLKPEQQVSVNSNLKTSVTIGYNGVTVENLEDSKYFVQSNINTRQWKHNEVGSYTLSTNGSPSASGYNPANSFHAMIVPLKFRPDVKTGTIYVKIPDMYSKSDNMVEDWDSEMIPFELDGAVTDNEVTSIELFDKSNKNYNTSNGDGTYQLSTDPNTTVYDAKIVITKNTKDKNPLYKPNLKVTYWTESGANPRTVTLTTTGNLINKGDKIEYKLQNISGVKSYLKIEAFLDYEDINMLNNRKIKEWGTRINYMVNSLTVQPKKLTFTKYETSRYINVNITAEVGYDVSGTKNTVAEPVTLSLRTSNQSYTDSLVSGSTVINGQTWSGGVFKNFMLAPGQKIRISGSVSNYRATAGNNSFKLSINGGRGSGGSTYAYSGEWRKAEYKSNGTPYDDNDSIDTLTIDKEPPIIPVITYCPDGYRYSNNWGPITFYFHEYHASYAYSCHTECKSYDSKGSCTSYGGYDHCHNTTMNKYWQEKRSFSESLTISFHFRSQSTVGASLGYTVDYDSVPDSAGWLTNPGTNAVVRAGQWYEFYFDAHYKTDRRSGMPSPTPYYSDMCNYLTRSPGVGSVDGARYAGITISGYGKTESYPKGERYSSSAWDDNHSLHSVPTVVDIFGMKTRRRYVTAASRNGTENYKFITVAFRGHNSDPEWWNGSNKDLCGTMSASIYIKDPLPVMTQVTEVQNAVNTKK